MPGRVYALGGEDFPRIKIGFTTNGVSGRLANIRLWSPILLESLWERPGGPLAEADLHRAFADRRHHGEWFDFTGEDDPVGLIDNAYQDWVDRKLRRQQLHTA